MRLKFLLKTAGKIVGLLVGTALVMGTLIVVFYQKEIKQLVINELNKNLNTPLHVEEFSFSIFRHFPQASVELKNVFLEDVERGTSNVKRDETSNVKRVPDTLLYAKRISLLFKINDIFQSDVAIRKVLIYDGKLNIRVDENGRGNYHILKESSASDSSKSGVVNIEKIGLSNVYLTYLDKNSNQDYKILSNELVLSGAFGKEKFSFQSKGDLFIDQLFVHGDNYVDHKPVKLLTGLEVNLKDNTYKVAESQINISGVDFTASGLIAEKKSDWVLDLSIKSKETTIAKMKEALPTLLTNYSKDINCKGKVVFNCAVKGPVGHKNIPAVLLDFTVKDGSLIADNAEIDKINFSGTYKKIKGKNINTLSVPKLEASLGGHFIHASIQIDNMPDAYLTLNAKSQLNLKEIQPFLHADTLESISGDLALNIFYQGKIKELENLRNGKSVPERSRWVNEVHASGNIDISHLNFKLKKNPLVFRDMTGNFMLHDNDMIVKNFCGNISSSDFCFNGTFKNFISFILIPGQSGDFQARVNSRNTDLDELLVNKSASKGDTSYIMKFNPRLQCELEVSIDKLHFRKFEAGNIHGHVNLDNQVISGHDLKFTAMGGNIAMNGTINAARHDSISMVYDVKFSKVDITRLFYELENFDQQTMTDKNVKGRVSADVQFKSMWSNDLSINSSSVRSTAGITIENGELLNFKPIQRLSKYIHVPDLNDIKFSTLNNSISIVNRKIYIPKMDINSSAINITGNGVHDFDNNIDYHLAILLSDVLGKKAKSNTSEFGEIADDGLGRTKLLLSMKGTVDDPHFAYDRKAAGEKIKNEIAVEKQNLKGILKQEFGLFKSDPSVQIPKPKKKEEMQVDWKNE